jgi:hypothetical protein
MPTPTSSPRDQIAVAAVVLAVAGTGLCVVSTIDAKVHGRSIWDVHLVFGTVTMAFGLSMVVALLVGDALDRRARRRLTLRAGRARQLGSMSQAAHFLRLTGRSVPEEVDRVLVGHDLPGLAAMRGWRVPRYERDPNLLVEWVESGESVALYALALLAAIEDVDLRAHLSGAHLLDPVLLKQRAANIRAASLG